MANPSMRHRAKLSFETLETRDAPSATPLLIESFDRTAQGALPSNWVQWSNSGSPSFAVSNAQALSGQLGLASTGLSSLAARTWLTTSEPADLQVSAAVYLNNLVPLQVLARGKNLETTTPSY